MKEVEKTKVNIQSSSIHALSWSDMNNVIQRPSEVKGLSTLHSTSASRIHAVRPDKVECPLCFNLFSCNATSSLPLTWETESTDTPVIRIKS